MKFSSVLYRSNPFEDIGFRLRAVASEEIKKGQLLLDGEVPLLSTHVISNCADADGTAGGNSSDRDRPPALHPKSTFHGNDGLVKGLFKRFKSEWSAEKRKAYAHQAGLGEFSEHDSVIISKTLYRNYMPGMQIVYGAALYRKLLYFNHSCAPNAFLYFGTQQRAYITSTRRIHKGEEITIAYVAAIRGDCAALHDNAVDFMGFRCLCKLCEKTRNTRREEDLKPPPNSYLHFTMPDFDLRRFYNNQKADLLGVEIVKRTVPQLMQTIDELEEAEKNFKLGQLLLKQERAWAAFCEAASPALLIHIGLHMCRSALIVFRGKKQFDEMRNFWQRWLVIFNRTTIGDGAHPGMRYGVLLHALFAKFFRAATSHRVNDFVLIFRQLLLHMQKESFPHLAEGDAFHMLAFHLQLLGWSEMLGLFNGT